MAELFSTFLEIFHYTPAFKSGIRVNFNSQKNLIKPPKTKIWLCRDSQNESIALLKISSRIFLDS